MSLSRNCQNIAQYSPFDNVYPDDRDCPILLFEPKSRPAPVVWVWRDGNELSEGRSDPIRELCLHELQGALFVNVRYAHLQLFTRNHTQTKSEQSDEQDFGVLNRPGVAGDSTI